MLCIIAHFTPHWDRTSQHTYGTPTKRATLHQTAPVPPRTYFHILQLKMNNNYCGVTSIHIAARVNNHEIVQCSMKFTILKVEKGFNWYFILQSSTPTLALASMCRIYRCHCPCLYQQIHGLYGSQHGTNSPNYRLHLLLLIWPEPVGKRILITHTSCSQTLSHILHKNISHTQRVHENRALQHIQRLKNMAMDQTQMNRRNFKFII